MNNKTTQIGVIPCSAMLSSTGGPGIPQRELWPLGTVQSPAITFPNDGFNKYGMCSLFPSGANIGSTLYSHSSTSSTTGRFTAGQYQLPSENIFHTYKVSDSLYSSTSYSFGAPTPPPGSPYSQVPMAQLEFLAKGVSTGLIQPIETGLLQTYKKVPDKYCEKRCNLKSHVCNCQVVPPEQNKLLDPLQYSIKTNMKKEPMSQLSELTTNNASIIKLEVMSPTHPVDTFGNLNVDIRESRFTNNISSNSSTMTSTQTENAFIQCVDEKSAGIGLKNPEETSCMAAPTVWQCSASVAPVPVEPIVPVPIAMPPLQVVRDPNTGGLLLVSTSGLESMQQTVVMPGYYHSPMILPSLPQVTSTSYQMIPSGTPHYFPGTSLQQQTQAHSTRLVALTTDNKKKIVPSSALIKIESDSPKSVQPVNSIPSSAATVITDVTPLITTHVIYQHPTNFIVPQSTSTETGTSQTQTCCKSQATSPLACLTPPPEMEPKETKSSTVHDASNQTDSLMSIEENSAVVLDASEKPATPVEIFDLPDKTSIKNEQQKNIQKTEVQMENDVQMDNDDMLKISQKPEFTSGLELLSSSIDQFESSVEKRQETEQIKNVALEGLDLLCALAEQRILEENENLATESTRKRKRDKKKSKRRSHDELRRKKLKSSKYSHEKKRRKEKEVYKSDGKCSCQSSYEAVKVPEYMEEATNVTNDNIEIVKHQGSETAQWLTKNEIKLNLKQKDQNESKTSKFNFVKKHFRSKSADDRNININNNFLPSIQLPILTETPKIDFKHTDSDVSVKQLPCQKRKVGRPKKLIPFSKEQVTTETIVAKKPKSSLIGYLLAAKEKFRMQVKEKLHSNMKRNLKNELSGDRKKFKKKRSTSNLKSSKIKPKLKAEATFKSVEDSESQEEIITNCDTTNINLNSSNFYDIEDEKEDIEEKDEVLSKQDDKGREYKSLEDRRYVLTVDLLKVDKLRVLTTMGGLFYAGQLNAIEPPDVYSIILDGERGNKPHIMSREEILRDALVEVSPQNASDLSVGIRVCAYWSQQYRCLYPGSVAEPNPTDEEPDNKFVLVEFDDGDSGRIDIKDIRFLPSDYPIIEYDLNPLLSLTKRKKKTKNKEMELPDNKETREQIKEQEKIISKEHEESKYVTECCPGKHTKKNRSIRLEEKKLIHKKKKKHKWYNKKDKERKHHKKHRKHKKHHQKDRSDEKGTNVLEIDKVEEKPLNLETTEEPATFIAENESKENDCTSAAATSEDLSVDVFQLSNLKKPTVRVRQESCESKSKMSPFLPARQLWGWAEKEYKRQKVKGRFKKLFYKSICRGKEVITVGDSAVFLSTGRPDRPYIGKIEAMWEICGTMIVRVKWFYHPEETTGCPQNLQYPGALFKSPHIDENDVQTISHKCEVVNLDKYKERLGDDPRKYATIYDNNDLYYLAGYYDPTSSSIKMEPGIPFVSSD